MKAISRLRRVVAGVGALAFVAAACGSGDDSSDEAAAEFQVVTTVAPITSIAANVIGECADIVGIVPEGTN